MFALGMGRPDTAKLLIMRGANVNIRSQNGDTALLYAASHGYVDIADMLLKRGADMNATTKHGYTASKLARLNKHLNVLALLKAKNEIARSLFRDLLLDGLKQELEKPLVKSRLEAHFLRL